MKPFIYLFLLTFVTTYAQPERAYNDGEKVIFRIHYGVVNAGYASIEVKNVTLNNQTYEHVIGKGWTTGMIKWAFPIDDMYQSYINQKTGYPIRAIRKIKEGKYTKNVEILFEKDSVLIMDHKRKKQKKAAAKNVQDMISAFYYLRNNVPDDLKINESFKINMFFDGKHHPFLLTKLRKETIKTKFGKVECFVFRPMVQSGRVFKKKESLSIWITADKNKIPVRIKADLAVGSLKADIDEYHGLTHPFNHK